jgi:hypothetical protein
LQPPKETIVSARSTDAALRMHSVMVLPTKSRRWAFRNVKVVQNKVAPPMVIDDLYLDLHPAFMLSGAQHDLRAAAISSNQRNVTAPPGRWESLPEARRPAPR